MKKSEIIIGVLLVLLLWSVLYIVDLKDQARAYREGRTEVRYTLSGDPYYVSPEED